MASEMDAIKKLLKDYDDELAGARERKELLTARSMVFMDRFSKESVQWIRPEMEGIATLLSAQGHLARLRDYSSGEWIHGIVLHVLPRHLVEDESGDGRELEAIGSSLTVETNALGENVTFHMRERYRRKPLADYVPLGTFPYEEFGTDLMESKVAEFLSKVFADTIEAHFAL